MAPTWSERPKDQKWTIVGGILGMIVAGVVAFNFAFESSTIVRYLIMAAGLLAGLGVGKWAGSR